MSAKTYRQLFVFTLLLQLLGCNKYLDHEISVSFDTRLESSLVIFAESNCKGKLYHPAHTQIHNNHHEYSYYVFNVSHYINSLIQTSVKPSLCIKDQSDWVQIWTESLDNNHHSIAVICNVNESFDYHCDSSA